MSFTSWTLRCGFVVLAEAALLGPTLPGGAPPARAQLAFAHDLYPLAKPLPSPQILIDVSDAPETRAWAEHAQTLAEQWFPIITQFLATEHWTPPKIITLIVKKELPAPAYTAGSKISINAKRITAHPEDFGMVIHELTHVIQSYPHSPNKPGWLVEGIADYIRFWRYEPDVPRPRVDPQKATYHDSYRTTAAFLGWAAGKYDRGLVVRLDRALRTGAYSDTLFQDATGKSLDTLWSEFVQTVPPYHAR